MNLPSPKLEHDALHRLVLLTVHDLYDIICVRLQNVVFGRKYVVVVGGGGDLVEHAQTVVIIQQKLRKDLLTCRSRETLDDFVTDVNLTIGGIGVEAHVNNARRHENEDWGSPESEEVKVQIIDESFINGIRSLSGSPTKHFCYGTLSKIV
jgi:hypothetical protein